MNNKQKTYSCILIIGFCSIFVGLFSVYAQSGLNIGLEFSDDKSHVAVYTDAGRCEDKTRPVYSWKLDDELLTGNVRTIKFPAPSQPGIYTVTATAECSGQSQPLTGTTSFSMPLEITYFALTPTNSITSNIPFTVSYTVNTTATTDYRLNFESQTITNSTLITGSGNYITATSPYTAGNYTVTLFVDYNGVSAMTSTLMTVTSNTPPIATEPPTDTPMPVITNTPKPPVTPVITNTPAPFPMLPAVYIEDCDGRIDDMNCTAIDAGNARIVRWKWTPPVNLPNGWYYTIEFLPAGDANAVFHTVKVTPDQAVTSGDWLTYSFDIYGLPEDVRSCYPYWDVVVEIDCPDGVCKLTEFPSRQRSLGTARPGSCPSGGGSSGGSQSGDRPPVS
jgi:hypothetical protein